ncbi:hypothetical protein ABC977_11650 [Thioalkalicoccus limnaeus]|uniref:Transposase n=1 Tax=Thioalkalicoccus limnaeus TaxID=120681 RepID=A0ABV4BH03_9GAMM
MNRAPGYQDFLEVVEWPRPRVAALGHAEAPFFELFRTLCLPPSMAGEKIRAPAEMPDVATDIRAEIEQKQRQRKSRPASRHSKRSTRSTRTP